MGALRENGDWQRLIMSPLGRIFLSRMRWILKRKLLHIKEFAIYLYVIKVLNAQRPSQEGQALGVAWATSYVEAFGSCSGCYQSPIKTFSPLLDAFL